MKVILLAGGGGTRLYPLSTETQPKQFLKLVGNQSLLTSTIQRFLGICSLNDIILVTNDKYKGIVQETLQEQGFSQVHVVCEPARKNTAPAITLALGFCIEKLNMDATEPIFVSPCDHVIYPISDFEFSIQSMLEIIKAGKIATLGIKPTCEETGYGYIQVSGQESEVMEIEKFCEKPSQVLAEQYLRSGDFFWNSGIYGFSYEVMLGEFSKYAPQLYDAMQSDTNSILKSYAALESISFDYAVSEKTKRIAMAKMQAKWHDIGSFKSYYDFCEKDANGNVVFGNVKFENCSNCLLIGHDNEVIVQDLIRVAVVSANGSALVKKI